MRPANALIGINIRSGSAAGLRPRYRRSGAHRPREGGQRRGRAGPLASSATLIAAQPVEGGKRKNRPDQDGDRIALANPGEAWSHRLFHDITPTRTRNVVLCHRRRHHASNPTAKLRSRGLVFGNLGAERSTGCHQPGRTEPGRRARPPAARSELASSHSRSSALQDGPVRDFGRSKGTDLSGRGFQLAGRLRRRSRTGRHRYRPAGRLALERVDLSARADHLYRRASCGRSAEDDVERG